MSSGYWRTRKQNRQFEYGGTLTQKTTRYITTWESRCYFDGIPDEVPNKIQKSMRAPSYKAIAIAILKNDHLLRSLGFSEKDSDLWKQFRESKEDEKIQGDMFDADYRLGQRWVSTANVP